MLICQTLISKLNILLQGSALSHVRVNLTLMIVLNFMVYLAFLIRIYLCMYNIKTFHEYKYKNSLFFKY